MPTVNKGASHSAFSAETKHSLKNKKGRRARKKNRLRKILQNQAFKRLMLAAQNQNHQVPKSKPIQAHSVAEVQPDQRMSPEGILISQTARVMSEGSKISLANLAQLDQLCTGIDIRWAYANDFHVQGGREVAHKEHHSARKSQNGVLILTTSGGGGHKAVANSIESEYIDQGGQTDGDEQSVYKKNVMDDFLGKRVGGKMSGAWDQALKKNDVEKQKSLQEWQNIGDLVVFAPIFLGTLYTLFVMKTPPKTVITTQPLGLSAIVKAARVYNTIMRKKVADWKDVNVEIRMTDLMSPKCNHYVTPLKNLSQKQREILTVVVPGEEQVFSDTVTEQIGTGFKEIQFTGNTKLPVNKLFTSDELQQYVPGKKVVIPLNDLTPGQWAKIQKLPNARKSLSVSRVDENQKTTVDYKVGSTDTLHQMMLGSQPAEPNVMNFMAASIYLAQRAEARGIRPAGGHHIRLLCGRDTDGKPSLFKRACDSLQSEKLPGWLSIVPLPFQSPANIAKGGMRSDQYFTRGGGATAMEHMAMSPIKRGGINIVSDGMLSSGAKHSQEDLLDRDFAVKWEGGNAKMLRDRFDADITCSHEFIENLASSYLGEGNALSKKEIKNYQVFRDEFETRWKSMEGAA